MIDKEAEKNLVNWRSTDKNRNNVRKNEYSDTEIQRVEAQEGTSLMKEE